MLKLLEKAPPGWKEVPPPATVPHGKGYVRGDGLRVLVSIERYPNGEGDFHVSLSYAQRSPTWEEIRLVAELFIGKGIRIEANPPQGSHPFVWHLWCPLA